ncbi:ABC-type multidrug transport system fused ATPase/permease subunit [Pullulanibacillus pueri]|uniref:Putative ABC transporter ATP-binding protein YknU n=1 Tax=Pullulanibacillus pueri TaxID=1437324 RepID=A0A8J2ZS25_9BACL|nr:ABC transporter ATP-binding protein [Pullulanibacillus pueri]MBM7680058.1 ABC-type multidrug transport system fused ATPase/permease subunit [Pullulanibacillus pueri]GGH74154.1 putative ABC transporter ATP-binding protein YknU [Pullulanibacillus pueri]
MDVFKRLKDFYWPYKRFFFGSLFFLFFVTGITVLYPVFLQQTIDKVVNKQNYGYAAFLAIGFILIMIVKGFSAYYQQYWGAKFGINAVYELRKALYAKLNTLPFRYYDNARTGDLMSRLTQDVEGFRFFLSAGMSQLIRFIFMVTFSLIIMFVYSWQLAIVTLIMTPFLTFTVMKFDKKVHPAFRAIRLSMGRMNTRVQENISGMNTVKALSQEDEEIKRFAVTNEDYKEKQIFTANIWAKFFPVMEFIGNLCVVVLLGFGGYLVIHSSMQPGELIAFFSLVWYIMGPLQDLGFIINQFSQAKASGERLLQILDEPSEIESPADAYSPEKIAGKVQFNHVTFQYPNETVYALKDVTFEARPGQVIGLMGATGSGKSTITQLIARFYNVTEGQVLVDGEPVERYSLPVLRKSIGYVLQENFLFSSTIRDNIAYGNPDAKLEDVIDAAKRAQAHEFIEGLPDGYDTVLGERGLGLSGGQKQRISIARALLVNPSILILDDATSAVDMQTEAKIQKAFRELMRGRTTFIIAHRISSVQHADEILVLDKGRIAERGVHSELIQNPEGLYRRIYDIQFKDKDILEARQNAH